MEDDITLAELSKLVGFGGTWVRKLAATDPDFPPRRRIGGAWVVSRAAALAYFDRRQPRRGRPPKQ